MIGGAFIAEFEASLKRVEQDARRWREMAAEVKKTAERNAAAIAHERAIHDALAESKGVTSWH